MPHRHSFLPVLTVAVHIQPYTLFLLLSTYRSAYRYESTIVGQFYGHEHHDDFEIFYDPASNFTRATSVAYIGPSVVAASSGNAGYKVYTIDGNYNDSSSVTIYMYPFDC